MQASWFLVYTLLVKGRVRRHNLGSHPNSAICRLCDYEKINSFSQAFDFLTIHVDDKRIYIPTWGAVRIVLYVEGN